MAKDEPQSYGSEGDRVEGREGEPSQLAGEKREGSSRPQATGDVAAKNVIDADGGARRAGYFKDRDYPE